MDETAEENAATFATELRRLRQRSALTVEGLAEASGLSTRTISGLELGESLGPRRRTVTMLADGLDLDEVERGTLERLAEAGRPRPATLPVGWCVPPPTVPYFAGRGAELARIEAMAAGPGPMASTVVLSGPGGVGKTTLAVEAGRRLADTAGVALFYLDLRGMDPEPLDAGAALVQLLRALGVANRDLPDDLDSRSGQFRALLETRPAVLIVDNVRDKEQVRPLLPGSGPATALVTSRRLLSGLEGVGRLQVPVLEPAAASAMLRSILGAADAAGPRGEGLDELAAMCGGLPLALRIVGRRLATRPDWSARQFAEHLAASEQRLQLIDGGDSQVSAAFGMSYDQLSAEARRLCRRLSLIPGPDFTPPLATVLGGMSLFDTEDLLDELVELGMLSQTADGRYAFHDLIRLFAGDRLADEEDALGRAKLTRAMTDWVLEVTVAAGRWFDRDHGTAPPDWAEPVDLSTPSAASAWLRSEVDHWYGALRTAAEHGWDRQVVDTAEALHWFSEHWARWEHWQDVFRMAAAAAERLGEPTAQAAQLNYLAWAHMVRMERREAADTALRAAAIAEEAGDVRNMAWGHQYAANALVQLDPAASLRYAETAERLFDQAADDEGRMAASVIIGSGLVRLGRPAEAVDRLRRVLEMAGTPQKGASRQMIADVTLMGATRMLARAFEAAGDEEQAEENYRSAIAIAAGIDVAFQQAATETELARLLHRRGRVGEAVAAARTARARFVEADAAGQAEDVARLLEEWGSPR